MFLALYSPDPCRPESKPTFLSTPFQVAATFTSLNTGQWEGFLYFQPAMEQLEIFCMHIKNPHMQTCATAIAYSVTTTSSTEHDLCKTLCIFHART